MLRLQEQHLFIFFNFWIKVNGLVKNTTYLSQRFVSAAKRHNLKNLFLSAFNPKCRPGKLLQTCRVNEQSRKTSTEAVY